MTIMDWVDDYGITNLELIVASETGLIRLDSIPASNLWNVVLPISVRWINRDGPQEFIIPGYPTPMVSDLASIPNMLQGIIQAAGPIKDPAVLHDGIYQYRPMLSTKRRIDRAEGDYLLYYGCMNIGKMHQHDAQIVFEAVRIAGSKIWHLHDKDFDPCV